MMVTIMTIFLSLFIFFAHVFGQTEVANRMLWILLPLLLVAVGKPFLKYIPQEDQKPQDEKDPDYVEAMKELEDYLKGTSGEKNYQISDKESSKESIAEEG